MTKKETAAITTALNTVYQTEYDCAMCHNDIINTVIHTVATELSDTVSNFKLQSFIDECKKLPEENE